MDCRETTAIVALLLGEVGEGLRSSAGCSTTIRSSSAGCSLSGGSGSRVGVACLFITVDFAIVRGGGGDGDGDGDGLLSRTVGCLDSFLGCLVTAVGCLDKFVGCLEMTGSVACSGGDGLRS